MINGFCATFQQDIGCLNDYYIKGNKEVNSEQQQKVHFAAIRILASVGLGFAVIGAFKTLATVSTIVPLLKLATAASLYVFSHDIFIITRNAEKGVVGQIAGMVKAWIFDLSLWAQRKKLEDIVPHHPWNEGTILQPFWDLAALQSERE